MDIQNKVFCGNASDTLKTLPDAIFNCIITSPPYYGLRDYGTAKWDGGDANCNHKVGRFTTIVNSKKQLSNSGSGDMQARNICPHCGARRIDAQVGQEQTPDEYVARLVEIFHEARRTLRDDGTLWLNIGDSYSAGGRGAGREQRGTFGVKTASAQALGRKSTPGFGAKQLLGIPWRVALALQADGWILRSDIIWNKPNVMPSSVKDRPTTSHEYVFLFSKKLRYYYNADAMREKLSGTSHGGNYPNPGQKSLSVGHNVNGRLGLRNEDKGIKSRNARTVWAINTEVSSLAHTAIMPRRLVRKCLLAGCPPDGIVLDPFGGSGTTGVVARSEGRRYTLIELNPEYVAIAEKQLGAVTAPIPNLMDSVTNW